MNLAGTSGFIVGFVAGGLIIIILAANSLSDARKIITKLHRIIRLQRNPTSSDHGRGFVDGQIDAITEEVGPTLKKTYGLEL